MGPVLLLIRALVHHHGLVQDAQYVSQKSDIEHLYRAIDCSFQLCALQHAPMVVHVLLLILAVVQRIGVAQDAQHVC